LMFGSVSVVVVTLIYPPQFYNSALVLEGWLLNSLPRIVLEGFDPSGIYLTDTTLRDGQQGLGYFTVDESLALYEVLVELDGGLGVIRSVEVFLYTEKDRVVARRLLEYGYEYPRVTAWIRASRQDLSLVSEAGLEDAVVLTSISDYHILYKLGLSRSEALERYLEVVREAYSRGISVKCALEDVTRADPSFVRLFLERLLELAERSGFEARVRLSDTLGLGLPFREAILPRGIPRLVWMVRSLGFKPENIGFHGHNDLGLVVANHLAAWASGAFESNCTLLGVGERAGNCPLELMLLHYAALKGVRVNLKAVWRAVEVLERAGFKMPEFYPLVGSNAFKTKAGIHVDGLLKNPQVYLPFDPMEVLGVPYGVEITPYSGRAAVVYWLASRGVPVDMLDKDSDGVALAYKMIQDMFKDGRRKPLTDEEMAEIVRRAMPEIYEAYIKPKLRP